MKHCNPRRLISLVLAFVMVFGLLPTGFANAQENHVAAVSEVYEAPESLAPKGTAFNIDELLAWTPESDPDAAYSRASVPLAKRKGGFQVNPMSNPEAKLMLCALNDNPVAQGSESMLSYAFNYWQYVDSYIYWGGNGEGFIQGPTGEVIDAAHTNGVPIVGVLGFPWGSGYGYVEQVSQFCQKAEDGSFPVADKLIEVMDYYGFDGWFFNQESYGCSREIAARLNEMMRYMHAKRPDIVISWYDSMVESGGVSYQDAVNDTNKFWMTADENGNWGVDEFFMNYNWTASKVNTTINTMNSIGRSQYDAFAGFNMQSNVYGDQLRDHLLVDEDGVAKLSLALYYSNQTQTVAKDGVDFHRTEQGYYVNDKGDPRDTSVDVANSYVSTWAGMSRFFADKSPITSAPFVTDFNTGHGLYWFVNGEKVRDAEWSYQSNQDVLPTFTWIIDSEGSKLVGGYDFEDAFNGGSSVKFSGTLDARNDILLYSTFVDISNGMKLNLTAKGGLENASLVAYLGDSTTASYETCEQVAFELTTGEGWVETVADLSAYAGKTLYGIGLQVDGEAADYTLNLGRLSVIDKNRAASNGPSDLRVESIAYTDAYSAEARVRWSKVTGASSYEIYKVHADGSKSFIMETPNTAYYIPVLTRDADEADVTIEVVPVNRNGIRGKASELVIDWAYGNDDGDRLVKEDAVNVNLGATVTGYSEQGDGAECSKALDGVSGNASKWWASGVGDWFSIDLGEPKTIKRVRMEHAEAGGEGKDLNTSAYTISYKDASGNWVTALQVTGNTDAVNDLLLETPITAQEWRLYINGIGPSPWSAVNIYEWQMFETGFPATEPVAMRYASAFNGEGASDTFTLKNVPATRTVKVYNADGELIGETTGSGSVELTGLDFGTAEAGRVFYTVTESGYGESVKFSAPFEAENAEKSEPATDVEFVKFSQPGSVSSSNGDDIYTTLTVSGLSEGDVVYVLGAESVASVPVAPGETSVRIEGVRVTRAGGQLALQVKRVGSLISDVYYVETPAFDEPTATIQVFARNAEGETLTGVRFDIVNEDGDVISQMSTTSDSGAKAEVALGTYTISNTESPEGYGLADSFTAILRIEGWQNVYEVTVPAAGEEPDPTDPPEEADPTDDSRDIPVSTLTATAGDWERNGGASEGPPELALDNDYNTLWHTDWKGTSRENHWIQFELSEDYIVDGLRYKPRGGANLNGTITRYDILVSDNGESFRSVATGNWAANSEWKIAQFHGENVKYVRLVSIDAKTDNSWVFASAAEIRLTGEKYEPTQSADKEGLNSLIAVCEQYEKGNYTDESWNNFQTVLEEARTVAADPNATQAEVNDVTVRLSRAMTGLQEQRPVFYTITIAEIENGTVTADKTEAVAGETVTLTVTPAEGYKLAAIYVNGIAIEGDTFQMPGRDVVITAEFVSDGSGAVDEETIRAAQEAAAAAEAAQKAAEEAQRKAEEAQAAAEEAAASSAEDKEAAEAARKEAEEAVAAAEAAQKAAEEAQAAAEAAQAAAEAHDAAAAQAAAEAAKHAQEVAELNAQIAAMKSEMAEYLKDAQKAAEEAEEHNKAAAAAALSAAKYEALIELALYVDPEDYDAATAALIAEAINAGIEAINAAETIEAVQEALEAVLAEIDELAVHMPFVDVPADSFYFAAVKWALKNQITTGTTETTFSPDKAITRAEAITFLWRAAGSPEPTATVSPFVDVKESDFFFKAVLWALETGITTGLDQNHFGPYATANRAQVVTFLWRANGSPAVSVENPFTDVADKAWFHDAVLWALEKGVTTGTTATFFDAWGNCNRAHVVTFLYRASK